MVHKDKGFTLIELIMVIAILSLTISSLTGLLLNGLHIWNRVNNQIELQQNLRYALYKIATDIQHCKKIHPDSLENKIVLVMPNDHIYIYGLKEDNFQNEHPYQINGSVLYKKINGGDRKPLANFIQGLTFKYNVSDDIEKTSYVIIKVEGKLPNNETITFSSGAELKWKSMVLENP